MQNGLKSDVENNDPNIKLQILVEKISKRKKKKKQINSYFQKLRKCSTKLMLHNCLLNMSPFSKQILDFYLKECFIFDVFSRKVANKAKLFGNRQFFADCLEDPDILHQRFNFDNNLIKNFCIGAVNFISRYYSDISKEILNARK